MSPIIETSNWIDGKAVATSDSATETRHSPVDGRPVATFPRSGQRDVELAVAAARRAQPAWAGRTVVERGQILRRAAELMLEHKDELVGLVRAETGKPPADATGELGGAFEMAHFVAGEGRRFYGRTTTSAVPHKTVILTRAPVGVAGLIVAANTPLPNYAWKVFPALLCGNAAVLKPSEHTPASASRFTEILHDAGVAPGVLNLVHGLGPEAGAALVAHPDVDLVSFTGSCAAGRQINAVAGERLAKVCLELGGKNPLIVCDDADLDGAVRAAALSAFSNAGQRCAAGSRLVVFDAVYDDFRDRLVEATARLRVGSDDGCDLGPVVSERQLDQILRSIEAAQTAGAKVIYGGHRMTDPLLAAGCYVAPTLVEEVGVDDPISTTELFGPVATLHRASSFDEAVEIANASPYGLTAAVHTRSIDRAMTFLEHVQAGMAVVNGPTYGSEPHMPFGGVKQSGNGWREAGTEALDVYSDWKSVAILHDPSRT